MSLAFDGISSVHPIRGDEMRALRKLRRDYPRDALRYTELSPARFRDFWKD